MRLQSIFPRSHFHQNQSKALNFALNVAKSATFNLPSCAVTSLAFTVTIRSVFKTDILRRLLVESGWSNNSLEFRTFGTTELIANGFRLAAGGAFQHYRSIGKPHFNYTKKLSTEALHPRLRQTDVGGWASCLSSILLLVVCTFVVKLG
jgi:hypothetical protein